MIIQILLFILGFALLIMGADWLVDGASALARRYKISDLVIGLTIVALGTSAPELVVNTYASFQKHQDIIFGNVIGSNNFNSFVIIGLAGLITPLVVKSSTVWKEIPYSFIAVIILFLMANDFCFKDFHMLTRIDGVILMIVFGLFLFYVFNQLRREIPDGKTARGNLSLIRILIYIIIGLTGLIIGGRLVVNNAVELARILGMSEKIIGLTIVAAGTSLPELATSVVAAINKNSDIAVGNIIGSNIFNISFILATSSLIRPVQYDPAFNFDLYLLTGGTLFIFIAMFTGKKKRIDRWEAGILLLAYVVYMIHRIR